MEVILQQDIDNLGYQYDTVNVKPGYGRNYLIPQKMAVINSPANREKNDKILERIRIEEEQRLAQLRGMINTLKEQVITIGAKTGTSGKIFGSVTNVQIADAIKKATGIEINRRKITILDEVKTLGTYSVELDLGEDTKETLEFEVVAE